MNLNNKTLVIKRNLLCKQVTNNTIVITLTMSVLLSSAVVSIRVVSGVPV